MESSSSQFSNYQIVQSIVTLLGSEYKVINAYDNTDNIDLNGVISVQASNLEFLHHGDADDYRLTLIVSGQFLTAEDVNQDKISQMFDYILNTLDEQTIKNTIEDCAGVLINTGTLNSDGEANTCNLSMDLYMCKD